MAFLSESFKNRIKQLAGILNEAGMTPPQAQPQQAPAPQQQQTQQPGQQQNPQQIAIGVCEQLLRQFKNHAFLNDKIQKFEPSPDGTIINVFGTKGELASYGVAKNFWYNVHSNTPQDKAMAEAIVQEINRFPNYTKLVRHN